jgi:hypothetical protein
MTSRDGDHLKGRSPRVKRLAEQWAVATPHDLTYMSSVVDACKAAGLVAYEPMLRRGKRAWRYVFASAAFVEWVKVDMPAIVPEHSEDGSPCEQFEQEMYGFCSGYALAFGSDTRCLEPIRLSVWELKTPDLRMFGWFCAKNYLVLHKGEKKGPEGLERWDDYKPFIDEVVSFRNGLVTNLPQYVVGGLADVVSNRSESI